MLKEFCRVCEKRPGCVKICKELELYLKKDIEADKKELLLSNDYIDNEFDDAKSLKNVLHPPREEIIIKMYFKERAKRAEIAKKIRCSPSTVTRVVQKYERIFNQKKA